MKMRYDLLFRNGTKEKIVQTATEEQHTEIMQLLSDAFQNDLSAVVTFGDGVNTGRLVRASDLSQVQTEVLERDTI